MTNREKVVHMTLAFEPSEELVDRLLIWVRQKFGQGLVIEFEVDSKILGGLKLATVAGKYYDLSLKKMLAEKMKVYEI